MACYEWTKPVGLPEFPHIIWIVNTWTFNLSTSKILQFLVLEEIIKKYSKEDVIFELRQFILLPKMEQKNKPFQKRDSLIEDCKIV